MSITTQTSAVLMGAWFWLLGSLGASAQTYPPTPPSPSLELLTEGTTEIEQIKVLGSTVFSQAELQAAVAPFTGKKLTFEEVLGIPQAIANLYKRNGYRTSGAFIWSFDRTKGVVEVRAVEAKLEEIEVRGLTRLQESYVRDRIQLAADVPLNFRRLESALQLLQGNPLFDQVQVELAKGTGSGLDILVVELSEASPLDLNLEVNNRYPPNVGTIGGTANLVHRNLLGLGDRLSASVGFTEGVSSYEIGYAIPVNARNGTLQLRYLDGSNQVIGQPFAPLGINGDIRSYSIGFRQPIIRTPERKLALGLGLELLRNQTFLFDDEPFSFSPGPEEGESRLTVVRFSQNWRNSQPRQFLLARSDFRLGIGALGATVNGEGADGRFLSWLGQFRWGRALGDDATLVFRTAAQLSTEPLLPLEQISLGGVNTIRGYRQNQLIGDNGAFGSLEVQFPVVEDSDGIGLIQISPFIDAGTIWDADGETPDPSTIVGAGLGFRWQLSSGLNLRLDYGVPLIKVEDQGDSLQEEGLYFSVQYQPF